MKLLLSNFRSILGKTALATAALGILLAAGAPAAKANGWDDCNRRVSYTQMRYNEACERYGPYSSQARHWAHERQEAYARLDHLRHEYREHHPGYDWR
ncbi:MAG TPA: hypothetical protein VLX60_13515 [Terriglobales bacterium]|nr:hypothetical protein [Terriglobales bacterium]